MQKQPVLASTAVLGAAVVSQVAHVTVLHVTQDLSVAILIYQGRIPEAGNEVVKLGAAVIVEGAAVEGGLLVAVR